MCINNLTELYLSADEADEFFKWAFGENYKKIKNNINFMYAWNQSHGNLLIMNADDRLIDTIQKMIEIWKTHKD